MFSSVLSRVTDKVRDLMKRPQNVEQRHAQRHVDGSATRLFITFEGREVGADATIANVSDGGLALTSRTGLPVDATFACSLSLAGEAIDALVRIVWRRRTDDGYTYGVRCYEQSMDGLRRYAASLATR